ncbi:S8 family serine peptidase [Kitasatospora sp. NPDC085895]|uniref:S8 family serine peptidase n=1 Tax=Kitasatospora sp. NPDC085895 TaxID=3155057 RepID=UPI00344C924F
MSEGGRAKAGRGASGGSGTPAEAGVPAGTTFAGAPEQEEAGRSGRTVPAGWGRYLVAPRPLGLLPGAVPPIEASVLWSLLEEDGEVRVLGQVRPSRSRGLGAIAEPAPACPPIAVVAMLPERARALAANPQVVVEADQPLAYAAAHPLVPQVPAADPAWAAPLTEPAALTVRVVGSDQQPVPGAQVWAIGATAPSHAVTDITGTAHLTLPADIPETVHALYVRPVGGYWPTRVQGTALPQDGQDQTTVEVRALGEDFEGFPGRAVTGWGQQAMRLTQIPPTFRGHGTTIALLDAGIDADHPDLKDTVAGGHDFVAGSAHGWQKDATGRGTWCAGVIAAADNHTGMTGIAADTRLHALKLFPHGRVSHLLEALDWCLTHGIDLAQLNLACPQPSQLLAWKILDLRAAGCTLIAPAGDTGHATAFPATLPTVLSVGALAHTGTHPDHPRQAAWPGPYLPAYTPAGADLIAPGDAIITTSPDGDYTPADGTAIAAAHITALAALLLAHHDQLRGQIHPATHARVDHLTTLLRAGTHPMPGTDPTRTGAGLPDAPTVLGLTTPPTQAGTPFTTDPRQGGLQYAQPRT